MAVNPCGSTTSVTGGSSTVNISGCGCGGTGTGTGGGGTGGTDTGHGGGGTGGTTGSGPGGSTGSGPGGDSNPDGLDKRIVPPECIPIAAINHPYGSDGFEFDDYSFKTAAAAAIAQIPDYQTGDEIVSFQMTAEGLAYGGYSFLSNQPLVSNRKLTVTGGDGALRNVLFREETFGIAIATFFGWHYKDSFNVVYGPGDITIDGQMPHSIVPDLSPDSRTPAWLDARVCSAVVRHKKEVSSAYGFSFSFDPDKITPIGYWDDSGINIRAYFTRFTHYAANDTWNSDYIVTGATGGTPGESSIVLTQACDKAYTHLSGKFRHGNSGYTPTITLTFQEYDPNTGDTLATVGSGLTIGPLASTGAVPGDYDNNLPEQSYSLSFPALTPGSYYRLLFALDAGIGLDNLTGNFAL